EVSIGAAISNRIRLRQPQQEIREVKARPRNGAAVRVELTCGEARKRKRAPAVRVGERVVEAPRISAAKHPVVSSAAYCESVGEPQTIDGKLRRTPIRQRAEIGGVKARRTEIDRIRRSSMTAQRCRHVLPIC